MDMIYSKHQCKVRVGIILTNLSTIPRGSQGWYLPSHETPQMRALRTRFEECHLFNPFFELGASRGPGGPGGPVLS